MVLASVDANADIEQNVTPPVGDAIVATEQTPLLNNSSKTDANSSISEVSSTSGSVSGEKPQNVVVVLSLLLLGVFISNADGTIVLATFGTISSHFSQLENASWLFTTFTLAVCAAQPLLGKLSDIFGRKQVLVACYVVFSIGTILSGMGLTMAQVIAGRTIAGLGGAGMTVMVSILITDLVPPLQMASWRSYVNVVATLGRSLGGPIGGWLSDTIGWRWSFLCQVPPMILAIALVYFKLENPTPASEVISENEDSAKPKYSKFRRIDFIGSVLLTGTIIGFILGVDLPGRGLEWSSPLVVSLLTAFVVLGTVFLIYEGRYAQEPIFPPRLLVQRKVTTVYITQALQMAAQMALMFSVPLYFQVTQNISNTVAGSHLVPSVFGNAVGALVAGVYIRRTGRYAILTILGASCAVLAFLSLILTWHGQTTFLESLEIFPAGFGTGIVQTSTFIALASNVAPQDMAVTISGSYLLGSVGMVLGISLSSSIQKGALRRLLWNKLEGNGLDRERIIREVMADVTWVWRLKEGWLKSTVVGAYVESLEWSHGFSALCSGLGVFVAFIIPEHALKD